MNKINKIKNGVKHGTPDFKTLRGISSFEPAFKKAFFQSLVCLENSYRYRSLRDRRALGLLGNNKLARKAFVLHHVIA